MPQTESEALAHAKRPAAALRCLIKKVRSLVSSLLSGGWLELEHNLCISVVNMSNTAQGDRVSGRIGDIGPPRHASAPSALLGKICSDVLVCIPNAMGACALRLTCIERANTNSNTNTPACLHLSEPAQHVLLCSYQKNAVQWQWRRPWSSRGSVTAKRLRC